MRQKKKPAQQQTPAASPSPSPSPSPAKPAPQPTPARAPPSPSPEPTPSSSSPHTQRQQGQRQPAAEVAAPAAPATSAAAALQKHVARARASAPPCGAGAPTCTGTSTSKPAARATPPTAPDVQKKDTTPMLPKVTVIVGPKSKPTPTTTATSAALESKSGIATTSKTTPTQQAPAAAATESSNLSLLQDKLNDDVTTRKEEALCTKPPPSRGACENNRGRKRERGRTSRSRSVRLSRSRSRSRSRSWSRSKSRCRCRDRSRSWSRSRSRSGSSQSCRTSDSQELASDDESLEKYMKNSRCQEARRRVSKTVTLIRELRNQRDSARQQVQQLESKSKDETIRKRLPDPVDPDSVVQAPKKPRTTSGNSSTMQSERSKTIPQLPDHKDMGKIEDTPKVHDPVKGMETVSAEAVDRPKTTDSGLKFLSQKQGKLTILEVCLPHSLYEGSEQWPDEPFYFECNRVDNSSRFNIFLQVDPYKQSYDYKVQANDEETHQHFVIKPTRIHTRRCIWSRSNSQHKSKWQFVLTPNEHGKAPESTTGTSTNTSSS
ncbi:hypothetical protein Pelo_1849 [Pelomyxa schiedti]|nr:hypothetical protein Pelo_1849 [Pelomyxa schiedti]